VAIHGGKDMEERIRAIAEFKALKKDILGNIHSFLYQYL
jgi:superfamily II DNA/RNA helicase